MIWQDLVITICVLVFNFSLIPQIFQGFRQKKGVLNPWTCIPITVASYVLAVTYLTMNLIFSTIIGLVNGTLWFLLLMQRFYYR